MTSADHFHQARVGLQVAVIAMSAGIILFAKDMLPGAHKVFWTLVMTEWGVSFYRAWRMGLLSKTPGQLLSHIRTEGPISTPLERAATVLGVIAVAVLLWPN